MSKYLIVDTANLFFRCLHNSQGDAYSKAGLAVHIMLRSIKKMWRDFGADHVVFCLEGRSWRNEIYPQYKGRRKVLALQKTNREREDDQVFTDTMDEFVTFLRDKTNCTVLQHPRVEGDDFCARWIQIHPEDEHILVTGDSDFIQMLKPNVKLYDGVRELLITQEGVFNKDGQPMQFKVKGSDGKLQVGKELDLLTEDFEVQEDWWQYALYVKCIRGDTGDSIFSAYPKVRETKLRAAWDDRASQGFNWNNLMLQTWDKDGAIVRVIDEYNRNRTLIDLTQQPDDIKNIMDETIIEQASRPRVQGVGIHFMRFCDRNGLINVGKEAADHAVYLNAPYAK